MFATTIRRSEGPCKCRCGTQRDDVWRAHRHRLDVQPGCLLRFVTGRGIILLLSIATVLRLIEVFAVFERISFGWVRRALNAL